MEQMEREKMTSSEEEAVVEAVLFTMGKSVELRHLSAALECDEAAAKAAVLRLKERYEKEPRGIQIIELEGSYQMCTKSEYYEHLIRVACAPKKQILTDVVLETLSIIAYKQPITKLEIEKIRGVKSDHAVNRLIDYNLVYEVGRLDAPGRPALFATTEEFLRRFGVSSTTDLPEIRPQQMDEFKLEVEEELQLTSGEIEAVVSGREELMAAEDSEAVLEETGSDLEREETMTGEGKAEPGDERIED